MPTAPPVQQRQLASPGEVAVDGLPAGFGELLNALTTQIQSSFAKIEGRL